MYLTEAMLEFRLTAGRFAEQLERKLAAYIGVRHCALVSSGSSANLLAFHTLTSPLLGDRRICRGDEVISNNGCAHHTVWCHSGICGYYGAPV